MANRRLCDSCGTPLGGKKGHGFVKGNRIVCGREEVAKTIKDENGYKFLDEVKTPDCKWSNIY